MTATPWGFRDILPEEAQAREEIALTVKGCFREHHYLPVETPLLEDKGSLEEGGRIADTPFKLFDDDGRLLVVRPDNTLPIVRLVSTRMRAADLPLRLRYEAPVVRECQRNAGGSRQFTQLGFELIGVGDTAGDPFKDTSGPAINILIKLLSMVSIVFAGLVVNFHLL